RTIENPGGRQFVRERLKEPEQKIELAAEPGGGLDELERAARIGGDLRGKPAVMVMSEHVEAQTDLLQVVNAFNPLRACFGRGQGWEQEGRQNADDGD